MTPRAIPPTSRGELLPGFATHDVDVDGVLVHARVAGGGDPVLLLHGYPQTHVMWHRVAPRLAEHHTVVLADLRGYGDSAKPDSRGDHATYSKRAMAADRTRKKKQGDRIELLLLGDSIAAGLGADRPRHTLGAHLARRLARRSGHAVRLHTAAVVGSESSALRAQLAGLPAAYRPDVAVIVVGGDDVTHRVRTSESVRHLSEAVEALHRRGCAVVVGTCPDLGAMAALPQPLRALGGRASRALAVAQRDAAVALGARAVALAEVVGPFFISQPDAMFSEDRFHPSSAGYRRTAKALLPSVLAALGYVEEVPFGHHAPTG